MARPDAVIKGGFYPIQSYIMGAIIQHLSAPYGGRALDPCAGEALALCQIAEKLKLEPYGSELHTYRAADARTLVNQLLGNSYWRETLVHTDKGITRLLNDDMQNISTPKGAMQIVYCNPPYDTTKEDGRVEYTFLKNTNHWLQTGGILVFVIPQHVIGHKNIAPYLAQWFDQIMVYGFPKPEFDIYHQIVMIGRKRPKRINDPDMKKRLDMVSKLEYAQLKQLDAHEQVWEIPKIALPSITFRGLFPNPDDSAREHAMYGVRALQAYQNIFTAKTLGRQQPIMYLKVGHTTQLITAGGLDNELLEPDPELTEDDYGRDEDGEPIVPTDILIKGRTEKAYTESIATDENAAGVITKTKAIRTQHPLPRITTMNPSGVVSNVDVDGIVPFLNDWLPQLSAAILKNYSPKYDFKMPKWVRHHQAFKNGTAIPAQRHAVAALLEHYKTESAGILQGEMGTGKTRMAAFLNAIMDNERMLVLVPPHLVKKWIREIKIVSPEANVIQVDTIADVDNWMSLDAAKQKQIAVLKFTSARMTSGWVPALEREPTLFNKTQLNKIERKLKRNPDAVIALTPEEATIWRRYKKWALWKASKGIQDSHMGEPLLTKKKFFVPHEKVLEGGRQWHHSTKHIEYATSYQRKRYVAFYQDKRSRMPTTGYTEFLKQQMEYRKAGMPQQWARPTSKARWRIADHIKNHYPGEIDLLVVDEAHETKGHDSDQGYAMARLAKSATKTLLMTGTLYGGRASTIFYLLYRTDKEMRQAYTDTSAKGRQRIQVKKWIDDFGMYEFTTTTKEANATGGSGNKRVTETVKEAPGSSPAMLPWLLGKTVFISLADLGTELPDYEEIPMPMEGTEEQKAQLAYLEEKLGAEMRERLSKGDRGLLASYLQNMLGIWDAPYRDQPVIDPRTKKEPIPKIICTIPAINPDILYPKEEAIIQLCKDEIANDRKVLLLVEQTRTRDITPRWMEHLKAADLRPKVLQGDSQNREAWIAKTVKDGTNVLMTHAKSVSVGLDLLDFPTIIWMAPNYSIYTVLQASRRSYRIGQDKPIKVYFFYYQESMQEAAIQLTAEKAASVMRVNGDSIALDSLAASAGNSIEDALTRMVEMDQDMQIGMVHEMFTKAAAEAQSTSSYHGDFGSIYEEEEDQPEDIILPVLPAETVDPPIDIDIPMEQTVETLEAIATATPNVVIVHHDEDGSIKTETDIDGNEVTKATLVFGVTRIESKSKKRKKAGLKPGHAKQISLFDKLGGGGS